MAMNHARTTISPPGTDLAERGVGELEEDLHRHMQLENSVLFPAAQAVANH